MSKHEALKRIAVAAKDVHEAACETQRIRAMIEELMLSLTKAKSVEDRAQGRLANALRTLEGRDN